MRYYFRTLFLIAITFPFLSWSQQKDSGVVERVSVHGTSLEGNLSGDSPDRSVSVYLPSSYHNNPDKRYPVVYFLHGYTDDDAKVYGFKDHWMSLPPILDSAFTAGSGEMIVVTPDAFTRFQGSMYSSSVTTGNWEGFIASELVEYIDNHYRTLARRESRGLSGHSMGGYGALRIGMKYPEVFSSIYLLSPCCLSSNQIKEEDIPTHLLRADSIQTMEEFLQTDFIIKAQFASAAAWSPNPNNPPFFLDLPVQNGQLQPEVLQKWNANRPLSSLDQYIFNVKSLEAIGFDAGNRDTGIAKSIARLHDQLDQYGIEHAFEIYEGDHIDRVAERIESKMLKFFTQNLVFEDQK